MNLILSPVTCMHLYRLQRNTCVVRHAVMHILIPTVVYVWLQWIMILYGNVYEYMLDRVQNIQDMLLCNVVCDTHLYIHDTVRHTPWTWEVFESSNTRTVMYDIAHVHMWIHLQCGWYVFDVHDCVQCDMHSMIVYIAYVYVVLVRCYIRLLTDVYTAVHRCVSV